MKHISILGASLLGLLMVATSCNDEWEDEQYAHYVAFSAPLDNDGVKVVNVPYTRCVYDAEGNVTGNKFPDEGDGGYGISEYDLPVVIAGSTTNPKDVTIHFDADPDTLYTMNVARFQNRTDLYYQDMTQYATYPKEMTIPAGKDVDLMNIKFDFRGIDMSKKWVLPIQILDNEDYGYQSHPRQYYAKALLRVYPFNDWSGLYSGTSQQITIEGDTDASVVENVRLYVVDENTVFVYGGLIDEDRKDRANYKINLEFVPNETDPSRGTVKFTCNNPQMKFKVNKVKDSAGNDTEEDEITRYTIIEEMDATQNYLLHRYVIINNVNYTFTDYGLVPGYEMSYTVKGSLTGERKINTQEPDPQHAIDWD